MNTSLANAQSLERHKQLGILAAVGGASCFGITIVLARFAFDAGANLGAVVELRVLFAAVVLGLIILITGRSFKVPREVRGALARVTLGNFGVTLGYLTAIQFIPVSLTVVIFYTYPLMVAATAPFVAGEQLGRMQIIAFPLAFAGLALALGPSFTSLDWHGVVPALVAAAAAAFLFRNSPRAVAACGPFTVGFYVNLMAAVLMIGVLVALGGVVPPGTAAGWAGMWGVSLFYVLGMVLMFTALHAAGPTLTSLLFNAEPLVVIAGAAILLGERLTPLQLGGVALVVGALMLTSLRRPGIPPSA